MGKRKWWKKKIIQKQPQQEKKPVAAVTPRAAIVPAKYSKPCHEGVVPVFEHKGVTFWGGRAKQVMAHNDWDLMVLFSDRDSSWESNEPAPFMNCNHTAREKLNPELFLQSRHAPWIGIDWPDFWEPTMPVEWWWTLLDDIFAWGGEEQQPKNVAFGCTGGHGRTGTALSVVRGLLQPQEDDSCPVAFVRSAYCDKCVESRAQTQYIEEITGIAVKARPSWVPVATPGYNKVGGDHLYGSTETGPARDLSAYEIGNRHPITTWGQADESDTQTADRWAREQEAKEAREKQDMARIVDAAIRKELGIADGDPLATHTADGRVYQAVTNAAGDITRWEEKKDVAI